MISGTRELAGRSRHLAPIWGVALGISVGLALAPLQVALLLMGGSVATVLLIAAPMWGLAAVALAVPFGGAAGVEIGGLRAGPVEAGAALTLGVVVIRGLAQRRLQLYGLSAGIPLTVLLIVLALSAAEARNLSLSLKEAAKWAMFGSVIALAATLAIDLRSRVLIVGVMVVAGAAEAWYGLNQAALGAGPLGFVLGGTVLRAFGHFGQPNPFAAYLSTVIVLALAVALAIVTRPGLGLGLLLGGSARRRRARFDSHLEEAPEKVSGRDAGARSLATVREPTGAGRAARWGALLFLLAGAALCISAVGSSLSRSAWLGLAAAAAVAISAHHPRGLATVIGLAVGGATVLGLAGTGWLPTVLAARVDTLFQSFTFLDPQSVQLTSSNFAVVHRMAIWQAAWEMFLDNPWFGVGPGNFDIAYPLYALPGWPQPPGHAHNFYLNLLAETGLPGLLAYLGVLGYLAVVVGRAVRRTQTRSGEPLEYGCALAGLGLVALLIVYQLFDNLYVHSMNAQAGIILGLALCPRRSPSPDRPL